MLADTTSSDSAHITNREKIWNFIKENPGHSCQEISILMEMAQGSVSSQLTTLYRRGDVARVEKHREAPDGSGPAVNYVYMTATEKYKKPLVGGQRKPKRKPRAAKPAAKWAAATKPQFNAPLVKPQVKTKTEAAPTPAPKLNLDVESMTVGEARSVYAKLREFFGDANV